MYTTSFNVKHPPGISGKTPFYKIHGFLCNPILQFAKCVVYCTWCKNKAKRVIEYNDMYERSIVILHYTICWESHSTDCEMEIKICCLFENWCPEYLFYMHTRRIPYKTIQNFLTMILNIMIIIIPRLFTFEFHCYSYWISILNVINMCIYHLGWRFLKFSP